MSKAEQIRNELVKDLQSKNEEKILETLSKIRSLGTADMIPELLKLWFRSTGKINAEVNGLLYSLKDKGSIVPLVLAMKDKEFLEHREQIISVFWNANLQPVNFISDFVKIAIEGSFMESIECLTVIENTDPPFPEEQRMESLVLLKQYFDKAGNMQDQKYELLRAIATIINYSEEIEM